MDEVAFVAAMQRSPDDHLIRLVYADWLEERGDSKHELIRVAVRLEDDLSESERQSCQRRFVELIRPFGATKEIFLPAYRCYDCGSILKVTRDRRHGVPNNLPWSIRNEVGCVIEMECRAWPCHKYEYYQITLAEVQVHVNPKVFATAWYLMAMLEALFDNSESERESHGSYSSDLSTATVTEYTTVRNENAMTVIRLIARENSGAMSATNRAILQRLKTEFMDPEFTHLKNETIREIEGLFGPK